MSSTKHISESEILAQLLRSKQRQLNALSDLTNAINLNLEPDELYTIYENILRDLLGVDQLALFIFEHTWTKVVCVNSEFSCKKIKPDEFSKRYKYTSEFSEEEKEKYAGFKYIIPVQNEEEQIAFALLGSLDEGELVPEIESLEFAQTITSIVAVAVENIQLTKYETENKALEKELEMASKIQQVLVPSNLPKNKMYEFAGLYIPHNNIGGDYYDVFPTNRDELFFCIADISGKGVAAALVMATLQAYLNAIESIHLDDERFIQRLNNKVMSTTNGEKFITMFMATYNIRSRELTYINAGHNPPILVNDEREELLSDGCTLLGMFEEIPKLKVGRTFVSPGTSILCYTDGLTELENHQDYQFGLDRLRVFVQKNHNLGSDTFIHSLYDNVVKYKGERLFSDDISVLMGKFL